MNSTLRFSMLLAMLMVLLVVWAQAQSSGPVDTGRPGRPSPREQDPNELADTKADVAKMQSLLNAMQANFALVGNPTSPANHELELNMDMWRVLIDRMQRRVERLEGNAERSRPSK